MTPFHKKYAGIDTYSVAKRNLETDKDREEETQRQEREGGMLLQARENCQPLDMGAEDNDFSLRTLTLDFSLQDCRRMSFCYFKLRRL